MKKNTSMRIAIFGGVGLFIPKDVYVVMREIEREG
jgi:hypothetical protein